MSRVSLINKLLKERDALGLKLERLANFLANDDTLNNINPIQRELLFTQRDAMVMYHSILTRRILNLQSEEEK